MSSSEYVDKKEAAKSYRPVAGSMSPGLKRAREPFRVKNAILGLALGAFAVGIWAYSISAVKQDVFDDVDEEAAALGAGASPTASSPTSASAPASSGSALGSASATAAKHPSSPSLVLEQVKATSGSVPVAPSLSPPARGVLPKLVESRMPWLLDPQRKTLVWGAPSVDNIGKTSSKSS